MVECSPATRAARVRFPDDANSFLAKKRCGNRVLLPLSYAQLVVPDGGTCCWQGGRKSIGGAGYRSPYLSHAKRALYHLSYAPSNGRTLYSMAGHETTPRVRSPQENTVLAFFAHSRRDTFDSSVGRAVDWSWSHIRHPYVAGSNPARRIFVRRPFSFNAYSKPEKCLGSLGWPHLMLSCIASSIV